MAKNTDKGSFSITPTMSTLTATIIVGISSISSLLSYATLIFSSTCNDYLIAGIGLFFLAGIIISITISLFSSYPVSFASIQDVPVVISVVIAASLLELLPGSSQEIIFSHLFVTISIATIFTGIFFFLLGHFRLGNLVRFIPYPVLGGFLAGSGWILVKGGLLVATSTPLHIIELLGFIEKTNSLQLASALLFGLTVLFLKRCLPTNKLILPLSVIAGIVIFILTVKIAGRSDEYLAANGWLIGPFPETALWRSITFPNMKLIDWYIVLSQFGSVGIIIVLSAISFLLNESGVELEVGGDLDVNKDLRVTGVVNVATGILGVPASYMYLGSTVAATKIGVRNRSLGFSIGAVLILIFFTGASFLSFYPRFVAGGLLIFLGSTLMLEWLVFARKKIPTIDFALICLIVLVIEFVGFHQGIGIGVFASILIFVFRSSTVDIIKNTFDRNAVQSGKERSIPDQWILRQNSDQILVFQLDGFIFFGTAHQLYERTKKYILAGEDKIRFILMDMSFVRGIDSSAVRSFKKLTQYLESAQVDFMLVNLPESVRSPLILGGFVPEKFLRLSFFEDLDQAIEQCEDIIIETETVRIKSEDLDRKLTDNDILIASYTDMMAALEFQEKFESIVDEMFPYLIKTEIKVGEYLFRQNEICKDIFFIMRGQISLLRKNIHGTVRLQTLGPWNIVGEPGAFADRPMLYDAEVVKAGYVFRLTNANRDKLIQENLKLASEFQKLIITMLGNQLMKMSAMVSPYSSRG